MLAAQASPTHEMAQNEKIFFQRLDVAFLKTAHDSAILYQPQEQVVIHQIGSHGQAHRLCLQGWYPLAARLACMQGIPDTLSSMATS